MKSDDLFMTRNKNTKSPYLRIPLPPPLSHEEIEFVPPSPSFATQRLSDETVVAIGMALFDVLESRVKTQDISSTFSEVSGSGISVWGVTGRLESIQRSER